MIYERQGVVEVMTKGADSSVLPLIEDTVRTLLCSHSVCDTVPSANVSAESGTTDGAACTHGPERAADSGGGVCRQEHAVVATVEARV